jgi:hypothetical protein
MASMVCRGESELNKKEASEFLGKSSRSVADYVAQGRLKVVYVAGKNGKEASFDPAELKRFKEEMETPVVRGTVSAENGSKVPAIRSEQSNQLAALVQALSQQSGGGLPSLTELDVKPILSLAEVQRFTGIPRQRLMEAIKAKKLKACNGEWGRGWKIKRQDLNTYIVKL